MDVPVEFRVLLEEIPHHGIHAAREARGSPAPGHAQPLRELLSSDRADSGTGVLSAGRAAPSQTSVACSDGLDVSDFISASRRSYRAMVRWKARVARRRR